EKCVEVIHQRLHFRRVSAFDLVLSALSHFRKPRSELIEFGQTLPDLQKTAEYECDSEASEQDRVPVEEVCRRSERVERPQIRPHQESDQTQRCSQDQPR